MKYGEKTGITNIEGTKRIHVILYAQFSYLTTWLRKSSQRVSAMHFTRKYHKLDYKFRTFIYDLFFNHINPLTSITLIMCSFKKRLSTTVV